MSVSIHAGDRPLSEIFSNYFAFSIPDYQRPYSWTQEQASELLADILAFLGDSESPILEINPYFLGSIVLIKSENKPKADVVDGQQRLTTLTILLSVLRKLDEGDDLEIENYLFQAAKRVENIPARYRLRLRERDDKFFRDHIQEKSGIDSLLEIDSRSLTDSQRRIQENAKYFLETLQLLDEAKRERLVSYLVTRCFLVVVSTPDLDSAYRIFSVLNARGLSLSLTDLLKSEIIGGISEQERGKYTRIWETEEEDLGRDSFQELFSHIRMIHRKAKLRETALNEFRKYILQDVKPESFIDDILKPNSDALETIKNVNYKGGQEAETVNTCLRWLNKIDNFDWIPPAILYLSKYRSCAPERLGRFFTDLDRLAAGLMIVRANVTIRTNRYAELLTSIEEGKDLYADSSPLQLKPEEMNEILDILDGDLYLMPRIRKYVLLRLNSALAEGAAFYDYPTITVEHVLPQNPADKSQWLEWFKDVDRTQYVHKMGNLALLSHRKNSEAQNYEFEKKKEKYFASEKTAICPFVLTTPVLRETEWTPEVIDRNQKKYLSTFQSLLRL